MNINKMIELIKNKKRKNKMKKNKVVLTNGVFDLLHLGHLDLLKKAKELGDILIVAIDSDERVKIIKPGRPINDEQTRKGMLEAIRWVDKVIVFEDLPTLLKLLQPDFLVKGGDYTISQVVGREIVEGYGGKVVIIPLLGNYSSGRIITKVRENLEQFPFSLIDPTKNSPQNRKV